MNKKLNKQLIKMKYSAFQLKEDGQMPSFLFQEIAKCGVDVNKEYLEFLKYCAEKLIRVKNYYRKYSNEELAASLWFEDIKKERGFI